MSQPVCAVVGVGPGNGAAFARRFADEGYAVALLSRSTDFSERLWIMRPSCSVMEQNVQPPKHPR